MTWRRDSTPLDTAASDECSLSCRSSGPVACAGGTTGRISPSRENFAQGGLELVQTIPELVTNADGAIDSAGRRHASNARRSERAAIRSRAASSSSSGVNHYPSFAKRPLDDGAPDCGSAFGFFGPQNHDIDRHPEPPEGPSKAD
jgi:hypothetical protein